MEKIILIPIPVTDFQSLIIDCVNSCLKHSKTSPTPASHSDKWLDLNKLVEYDPEKRSKPTFYGYIHNNTIPYHKRGKKLIFLKSEIDEWLKSGRVKTNAEIEAEADQYLSTKKGLSNE
jgi:excisionase family DNA binding protein